MGQCKSTRDVEGDSVGKECYVGCSKQCFDHCRVGNYELPEHVGTCDSPQCKLMKRTILDIEGVFATHESKIARPESLQQQ